MSKPTITTIIPTYRRPNMLKKAILSVLNQTYPHFQVCIYDNASGDETPLVVAELAKNDPRVKYFCHQINIGALENFQFGLKKVETPFFSFLSDDDALLPDFYQIAIDEFEKYPEAMMSVTNTVNYMQREKIVKNTLERHTAGLYTPPNGLIELYKKGHPLWTSILFQRAALKKVGLIDPEIGPWGDEDFINRFAANYPFAITKRPGAIFVNSGQGAYYFQSKAGLKKMVENIRKSDVPEYSLRVIERIMIQITQRITLRLYLYHLKKQDRQNALKFALELNKSPGNNIGYAVFVIAIRSSLLSSLICYCVPLYRTIKKILQKLNRSKRLANQAQIPDGYHKEDILNVEVMLKNMGAK
jgi:glycosyltransferase involved in cell wall biosynthesis